MKHVHFTQILFSEGIISLEWLQYVRRVGKWWPHRSVLNGVKCLKWFKQRRPLFRNEIAALSPTSHCCCQFSIWMTSLFLFLASLCMFKLLPQLSHLLLWCAFHLSPLVQCPLVFKNKIPCPAVVFGGCDPRGAFLFCTWLRLFLFFNIHDSLSLERDSWMFAYYSKI